VEQRNVALRVGCGDVAAGKRWSDLQIKLGELEQADHFHAQLRAEVLRVHQAWTPEIQARRDARRELEGYFDSLRSEVQNLVGELKTFQVPPPAKVKRFQDATLELWSLNQKLAQLTGDRKRFIEERRTAQDWLGSTSHVLHFFRGATPPPRWPWQDLFDRAQGHVTTAPAAVGTEMAVPTGGKRRN
jgi:hypothetical protein